MAADVEMKEIAQDKAVFGVLLISCGFGLCDTVV